MNLFKDMYNAGRMLSSELIKFIKAVLILMRVSGGDVPLTYKSATSLCVPRDIFIERKIGVPGREEPIRRGGVNVLNDNVINLLEEAHSLKNPGR